MKGSEGNLAFPNMLNEALYSLSLTVQAADYGPTQPQYEVYRKLNERLDEQLQKWAQVKSDEVPKVAALIQQLQLPAISLDQKPSG